MRALETRLQALERRDSERADAKPAEHLLKDSNELETRHTPSERASLIDAAFSSETHDAAWAWDAESTVADAFASGDFVGTSLESLDCRTTTCRLAVQHDSEAARSDFERIAALVRMGAVGIPVTENGELRTIAYFIRKGYDGRAHPARRTR